MELIIWWNTISDPYIESFYDIDDLTEIPVKKIFNLSSAS